MAFPDEDPESQIDPTLLQHPDDLESPPAFDCDEQGHAQNKPCHPQCKELGSHDEELDDDNNLCSSPIPHHDSLESQVGDSLLVPVEQDTQPSINYDISPIIRRAADNSDSNLAESPPPVMAMPLFERQKSPRLADNPAFRFGTPPNPNRLNLTRPLPGSNRPHQEMTANKDLMTPSVDSFPRVERVNGLSPVRLRSELAANPATPGMTVQTLPRRKDGQRVNPTPAEYTDDSLLDAQSETARCSNRAAAQAHSFERMSRSKSCPRPPGPVYDTRKKPARMSQSTEGPIEAAVFPLGATMRADLLASMKSQCSTDGTTQSSSQPKQPDKFRSPPFIDAALSGYPRPKDTSFPGAENTKPNLNLPDKGQHDQSGTELPTNPSASLSTLELVDKDDAHESTTPLNCSDQPENGMQDMTEVTGNEKNNPCETRRAAISNAGHSESRSVSRDFSRNQRPRSHNKNCRSLVPKHGVNGSPSMGLVNRPSQERELQPEDLHQSQGLHGTRDSGVLKRDSSGAYPGHHGHLRHRSPITGNEEVTATSLLQMAIVMSAAEREQMGNITTQARLQHAQLEHLNSEKAALQDRIKSLSQENHQLVERSAKFRASCERYKTRMNDTMKVQKELRDDIKHMDRRLAEARKEARQDMDIQLDELRVQMSNKSRPLLEEARMELDKKSQTIELLNRDINNRLLDLQRERGLRESLQKQLENRVKQEEELKIVLYGHQRSVVSILSSHEDMLNEVLSAGGDNVLRLTECQNLIKSLDENEQKTLPNLIELNNLVTALSKTVEKKLQVAEDGSIKIHDASVEGIAELKHRLELLIDDQNTQQRLQANISELREENAKLAERVQIRETEFLLTETHLNTTEQDLQRCRAELAAASDELSKATAAQREDASLHTQLQDLQKSYSIAKQQVEFVTGETERVKADLHKQENLTRLRQQEISNLQGRLQQSEAKIDVFDVEREDYVRQAKEESSALRLQLESDLRVRLVENEARHNGAVSGLRRQIAEADNKLTQAQRRLHDAQNSQSDKAAETQKLSQQLSATTTELRVLQDKALLMEQTQDQMENEISTSQAEVTQLIEKASGWSARGEASALQLDDMRKEMDDTCKRFENLAGTEINQLERRVLELQEKNKNSDVLISRVAGYLQRSGVLEPGVGFMHWAARLPSVQSQGEETDVDNQYSQPNKSHEQSAPSYEIYNHFSPSDSWAGAMSGSTNKTGDSASFSREHVSHVAIPLCGFSNAQLTTASTSLSFSKPPHKINSRHVSINEHTADAGSQGLASPSKAVIIPSSPLQSAKLSCRLSLQPKGPFHETATCSSEVRNLIGVAQTEIPDSQDNLALEVTKTSVRPTQKIAERKGSLYGANRMAGYSVLRSEIHADRPAVQRNHMSPVSSEDKAIDLRSVDSDEGGSDLSEPPENMDQLDSAEFVNIYNGTDPQDQKIVQSLDKKGSVESMASNILSSPKPNSSRTRVSYSARTNEVTQLKGILKRANSVIRTNSSTANTHTVVDAAGNIHMSNLQETQGASSNKKLSRTTSTTKGRPSTTHRSPYNRPVVGSKGLHTSDNYQGNKASYQGQGPSATDVFSTSSSPGMGQPQRNSKKRSLSTVGMTDPSRPNKLPRSVAR